MYIIFRFNLFESYLTLQSFMAQQKLLNYARTCVVGAGSAHSQGYDQVIQLRHSYLQGVPYFTKGSPIFPQFTAKLGTGVPRIPENRGRGSPILCGPQFCVTPALPIGHENTSGERGSTLTLAKYTSAVPVHLNCMLLFNHNTVQLWTAGPQLDLVAQSRVGNPA